MKKFLIIGIILIMLLSISQPQGKITVTFWTLFGGGEGYIMTNLIKQFNKENPNIEVQEQIIEWGQFYNKLLTAMVGGTPPDISVMHLAILPDYASRGVLNKIDNYVPKDLIEDFVPSILKEAYWKDSLYALPIDAHPIVLYYNKGVLKAAGLVDKKGDALVPKTWSELFDYAKKYKDKTGNFGLSLEVGAMLGERWWLSVYTQLGGTFFDKRTGKITVDIPKAAKTYELIKSFYDAGIASKSLTYDEGETLFQGSKVPYHINGVWAMAVYPTVKGLEFGVTNLPSVSTRVKPFSWADSHTLVFPKTGDTKKLEAAVTFARWFIQHTNEWAKAGHLPPLKSVLESKEFLALPYRKDYVHVADLVVHPPAVIGWTQLRQEMWEIGQNVILGKLSPEEAAKALKSKAEEVTAR